MLFCLICSDGRPSQYGLHIVHINLNTVFLVYCPLLLPHPHSLQVTIRVYHYHDKVPLTDLSKHTFLGESVFQMASLVTKRDKKLTPSLQRGREK